MTEGEGPVIQEGRVRVQNMMYLRKRRNRKIMTITATRTAQEARRLRIPASFL